MRCCILYNARVSCFKDIKSLSMSGNDGWFAHDVEQSHSQVDITLQHHTSLAISILKLRVLFVNFKIYRSTIKGSIFMKCVSCKKILNDEWQFIVLKCCSYAKTFFFLFVLLAPCYLSSYTIFILIWNL